MSESTLGLLTSIALIYASWIWFICFGVHNFNKLKDRVVDLERKHDEN